MSAKAVRGALALLRRWQRRRVEPHALVLMYHRVSAVRPDPWQLAVHPDHFESQLRVLRQHADIVPLARLHDAPRRARPVVAITFDDGHLDNLTVAMPVLQRYGAPATVFVTTGWTGGRRPFWWDRFARLLLEPHALPPRLQLSWGGQVFDWEDSCLSRAGPSGAQARRSLHDELWARLRESPEAHRDEALGRLERWAQVPNGVDDADRPMNEAELRQLVAGGLVEIGAHSVSHPRLSVLTTGQKRREIVESRDQCAAVIGRSPELFAFPYGDHDPESVALVREAGFRVACTTHEDLCWPAEDPLRTPRVAALDLGGEQMLRRLRLRCLI